MYRARKSKLLSKITVLFVICFFSLSAEGKYGGGMGGPNDPYLIYTAEQMNAIGADPCDWDKCFKLMADIDLGGFTGTSFNIIGNYDHKFTGVFDGNGHTISNFTYTSTRTKRVGIFGSVDCADVAIKDLGLVYPKINAGNMGYIGSLIGYLTDGTISNCYVEGGSVSGRYTSGGLVGFIWYGTLTDCHSSAGVSGDWYIGGLVGANFGTITNCYVTGSVEADEYSGGLAGANNGAYGAGIISGCYAMGHVSVQHDVAGGLVGFNEGIVTNSYSTASVSGLHYIGGLVGENYEGTITNCYSAGIVSGDLYTGGLAGENYEGTITASFWDIETSGQTTSAGGTGKTTDEMQMASTFVGWGCEPVWTIDEGKDYPRLLWENMPGYLLPGLCVFLPGSGTEADPYLIYTSEQFTLVGLYPCHWDKHFKLMADIDLSKLTGTSINTIGYFIEEKSPDNKPFTGVFDGNGHTIANFTYNSNDRRCIGVFGYVSGENAEIKNLGLLDPNVDAGTGYYVGSLVGSLREGDVTGCYVEGGSVKGDNYVGGLVGTNSYHGLTTKGAITNCYSTATVSGNGYVGGLVGLNCESTITNCRTTGTVSGNNDDNYYIGGLVGRNCRGIVTNSYSTACAAGESFIGGLVGYNEGTLTNCYAVGSVEGDYCVGGLAGQNGTIWGEGAITNSYSAGKVSGGYRVGGLVGYKPGYVVNSFWDIERSGQATSEAGEGKTTAEMRMTETFINWGSCGEFWTINEGLDYPRLAWEEKPGEPIAGYIAFEGDGSPNNPYLIHTAEELNAIRLFPCVWDKHFKLTANIDLSQYTGTEFNIIVHFSGTFDGNGHTISNFTYISKDSDFQGLFSDVSGEIKNLGLIDPNLDAGNHYFVGLLVGQLDNGTITRCYVEGGRVSGRTFVGELVGRIDKGRVCECYSTGSVSGWSEIGGLVGRIYNGTVTKSYSTASVTGEEDHVGGLVGVNDDTITDCYATGSASGDDSIGGLVGYNWKATITNCYATGSASGDEYVGALVGHDREGSYTKSFWDKTAHPLLPGIGNAVNPEVIGESTTHMQKESTFTDAGWDFYTPVWTIDEGVDYPRLWWELVPLLHAEPEITLGISNRISWNPVVSAVEYYAECAEDKGFTSIVYSTGWITETSFEFAGLELGKRYWYSVKARNVAGVESQWSNVESSLQCTLSDAVYLMLDPNNLKSENLKKPYINKINIAQDMIDDGLYEDALNKLENDIIQKTNGCAETGEPDKNDWIITCEEQSEIYPLIIETIEHVKALITTE